MSSLSHISSPLAEGPNNSANPIPFGRTLFWIRSNRARGDRGGKDGMPPSSSHELGTTSLERAQRCTTANRTGLGTGKVFSALGMQAVHAVL